MRFALASALGLLACTAMATQLGEPKPATPKTTTTTQSPMARQPRPASVPAPVQGVSYEVLARIVALQRGAKSDAELFEHVNLEHAANVRLAKEKKLHQWAPVPGHGMGRRGLSVRRVEARNPIRDSDRSIFTVQKRSLGQSLVARDGSNHGTGAPVPRPEPKTGCLGGLFSCGKAKQRKQLFSVGSRNRRVSHVGPDPLPAKPAEPAKSAESPKPDKEIKSSCFGGCLASVYLVHRLTKVHQ